MEFELSQEQRSLQRMIRRFAEENLKPGAAEREATGAFPREAVRELGRMGIFGLTFPVQYGGQGRDLTDYTVVMEELARHDPSVAIILAAHTLCASHINIFGNAEQKERHLPPLLTGEKLGAWAFAEPDSKAGSRRLVTCATSRDGEWRLSGRKSHVTNGSVADTIIVMAATAGSANSGDFSAFIVPGGASGLTITEIPDKRGFQSSDTVSLILRTLRIPHDNLLGNENEGLLHTAQIRAISRIGVAAMAVGIGKGSLERNMSHVYERSSTEHSTAVLKAMAWTLGSQGAQVISKREKQVLGWLKLGKSSWDISVILGISERTVYFHVSNIMKKLGASNRPQAVAIATRLGLIDND